MTSNSDPKQLPIADEGSCCGTAQQTGTTKESAVRERYSEASQQRQETLCCPIDYDPKLLAAIPKEVIEKDYGCGNPTAHVRPGDTVLDLGSGAGKLCFIASQLAGPQGKVIGVDCNSDMLAVARRNQAEFAGNVGFDNIEFRCGMIQDLQLDLELLSRETADIDLKSVEGLLALRQAEQQLRDAFRMIPDNSVDCVLSNCVLNLVRQEDRVPLFDEIYRVLRKGGRAAISDIVADEDVPQAMQDDGKLWSGCISGAWREDRFVEQFEQAGFYGIEIERWSPQPWQIVNNIEFRSVTVVARKGKEGECFEATQAVIYAGPFRQVTDDDGHTYHRGRRMAVCDKTYQILSREPYHQQFIRIEPVESVELQTAELFDCSQDQIREASETKGSVFHIRSANQECECKPDSHP